VGEVVDGDEVYRGSHSCLLTTLRIAACLVNPLD
jgi:hypothetical protein